METIARRETGLSNYPSTIQRSDPSAPHFSMTSETLSPNTARPAAPARSRRRSVTPPVNPLLPYKITLPELIHQRLRLAAIERGVSVSALTAQILDQHLAVTPDDLIC